MAGELGVNEAVSHSGTHYLVSSSSTSGLYGMLGLSAHFIVFSEFDLN